MPTPGGELDSGQKTDLDHLDQSEESTGVSSLNLLPDSTPSVWSRETTAEHIVPQPEWLDILRNDFGLQDFHEKQLEAIDAALAGRDVFVNIHTGGGKSLIYQLPSLLESRQRGAVTFIIGPMVSLKSDQMEKCRSMGIEAASIDYHTTREDRFDLLGRLYQSRPDIALFFVTPEMVRICDQSGLLIL